MEAGVFDLEAAIHYDIESCRVRPLCGVCAPQAELHPEDGGADLDSLVGNLG